MTEPNLAQLRKDAQRAADKATRFEKEILDKSNKSATPKNGSPKLNKKQREELAALKKDAESKRAKAKAAEEAANDPKSSTAKMIDPHADLKSDEDPLLKAFVAMGTPNEQDAKEDKHWNQVLGYGKGDEKVLINKSSDTIRIFNDEWSKAMEALDKYKEKYNVVLGASRPMQAIVSTWQETEKAGYEKADLMIAVVTAVPGAVKLIFKGPKLVGFIWKKGSSFVKWMAGAKNAEKFGSIAAQLLQRQKEIGKALALEAGKNLDEVVAKHNGSLGKAIDELFRVVMQKRGWHYLPKLGPQKAIEMGLAIPSVMEKGVDVSSLVGRVVANTHAALGAAAKGEKSMINAAKYAEDIEILLAIAKNEPKFLASLKTAVVDISMGMKSEMQEGSEHLMKWLGSLEKAPSVMEMKQIEQDVSNALEALKQAQATKDAGKIAQATRAVKVFEEQLIDIQKTPVVKRYLKALSKLEKAQEAAEAMGQATVKLLNDSDHALLTKLLEAKGDITKLKETMTADEIAKLLAPAADGGFPLGTLMGGGQMAEELMGKDGEESAMGQPIDLFGLSDVFGITNQESGFDAALHGFWGGITSPVQTYAEIFHSFEMQEHLEKLIKDHGDDMAEMTRLLTEAVTHLQLAADAIKDGRIPGLVFEKGESIRDNLTKLLKVINEADGASSEWKESHKAEFEKLQKDIQTTLNMLGQVGDKMSGIENVIREISHQLEEAKKVDKLFVLNPQILGKVEAARGALIFMMGDLQDALLLPQDFGLAPFLQFTAQQQAQLDFAEKQDEGQKSSQLGKGSKQAEVPPLDPSIDTGHYDDGHSFGWNKKEPEPEPSLDTGHYDDGHSFGWNKKSEAPKSDGPVVGAGGPGGRSYAPAGLANLALNYIRRQRLAQGMLGLGALIGGALGVALGGNDAAQQVITPPAVTNPALTNPPVASRQTTSFDPCKLVSETEAAAILGMPVTATRNSGQCIYQVQNGPAVFTVNAQTPRGETIPMDIRISSVVVSVATGDEATRSFETEMSIFRPEKGDENLPGFGSQAIYRGGGIAILQPPRYVDVSTNSSQPASFGSTGYPPVHEKFLSILEAFARPALQRMPSSLTSTTQSQQQLPAQSQPNVVVVPAASESNPMLRAILGALAGLGLAGLGIVGVAYNQMQKAAKPQGQAGSPVPAAGGPPGPSPSPKPEEPKPDEPKPEEPKPEEPLELVSSGSNWKFAPKPVEPEVGRSSPKKPKKAAPAPGAGVAPAASPNGEQDFQPPEPDRKQPEKVIPPEKEAATKSKARGPKRETARKPRSRASRTR